MSARRTDIVHHSQLARPAAAETAAVQTLHSVRPRVRRFGPSSTCELGSAFQDSSAHDLLVQSEEQSRGKWQLVSDTVYLGFWRSALRGGPGGQNHGPCTFVEHALLHRKVDTCEGALCSSSSRSCCRDEMSRWLDESCVHRARYANTMLISTPQVLQYVQKCQNTRFGSVLRS